MQAQLAFETRSSVRSALSFTSRQTIDQMASPENPGLDIRGWRAETASQSERGDESWLQVARVDSMVRLQYLAEEL